MERKKSTKKKQNKSKKQNREEKNSQEQNKNKIKQKKITTNQYGRIEIQRETEITGKKKKKKTVHVKGGTRVKCREDTKERNKEL